MKIQQLYMWELEGDFFLSKVCEECEQPCKVYCTTANGQIYCGKYVKKKDWRPINDTKRT